MSINPLERYVLHNIAIQNNLNSIKPSGYGKRFNIPRGHSIKDIFASKIAIKPSIHLPDLLGNVAKVKIDLDSIIGYSEGYIIPKTVYDNDINLYINTAVDISSNIHKLKSSSQDYIFIGCTFSAPALINDYRNTGKEPNVKMYLNREYLKAWEDNGGWNNTNNVNGL